MTDGERLEEAINTVRRWRAQMEAHERRLAELAIDSIDCTIGRATTLDRELDALNSRLAQAHGYKIVENADETISLHKSETTIAMTLLSLSVDSVKESVAFSASGDGYKIGEFSLSMKVDRREPLGDIERAATHKAAGILERVAAELRSLAGAD